MPLRRGRMPVRLAFAAGVLSGIALAVISGAGLSVRLLDRGAGAAQPDVTVNAAARHQVIDGWGVNANPKNWGNAAYPPLQPGIDLLVDDLGANIWRVDVYGKSNWEATNDDADPFNFNWTYYNQLYETAPFQSLWSTLAELNAKGIAPIISASGVVPDWMGGSSINNDDEFVETFVSLMYYARMVKHVQFNLVDPLNETDLGPPEGPNVTAAHMATILGKVQARLNSVGLSDLRLVAPETSSPSTTYNGALLGDPTVAPYMQVFAGHHYSQFDMSPEAQQLQSAGNTTARLWMTEYSTSIFGFLDNGETVPDEWAFTQAMATNLFSFVKTGAQAALVWDAYDNVHDHAGNYTRWGLLDTLNNYARKKRYYGARQVFAYVKPGSVRVDVTTSIGNLDLMAFVDDATGDVTIVGQNSSASAKTLTIGVQGVAAPAALSLTQTTPSLDNAPGGTISQSGGTYTVAVAANSIFTLTSAGANGTPTATATSTVGASATVSPSATATADASPTAGFTNTPTSTTSPTSTRTPTATATASATGSATASATATSTTTPSSSATATRTATPSATATSTLPAGQTAVFGITTSGGTNDTADDRYMNGSRFQLNTPGTLASLSVYVGSTPGNAHLRLALYATSASGIPSTLLAQTGEAVATLGWNTLPVSGGPALAGGTYWIVAQTDSASTVYRIQGGLTANDVEAWSPLSYGAFPPNASTAWTVVTRQAFDMYGTVLVSSATATSTASPSSTASSTSTSLPTATRTPTATSTMTPTASATATQTAVPTATNSPTPTQTALPTASPTFTATSTVTPTATSTSSPTVTNTPAPTATATITPLATSTPTPTPTTSPPTPTATPGSTVDFGITTSGGSNDNSDFGYMNGSRYMLTRSGRLIALSVFIGSTPANAHVRLALYSDTGTAPGALLAETGDATARPGWLRVPVPGGPVLTPDPYWIVAQTDNTATVYRIQGGLSSADFEAWAPRAYGGFPATAPGAWTKVARQSFDMYATIVP